MKKKAFIIEIVVIIIVGCFIVWTVPSNFLDDIKSENIVSISVRDGSTGKNFEITNQEDITFIVEKIQSQTFKNDGISMFNMGTLYTMSFYDSNNKLIGEFILNSNDTIRKDPFFYKTTPELSGLTEYLSNLK
jgi:hypothetical protein